MGIITLKYNVNRITVPIDMLVNELEYGSTFALYRDREDIIFLQGNRMQWVRWKMEGKSLTVEVDENFLENDYIFEKLLVAFLYNLLDFGELSLVAIDLAKSSYLQHNNACQKALPKYFRRPAKRSILGTILKPYYHLPLKEKIGIAEKFVSMGIELLKEDETFFTSETRLLEAARAIQSTIEGSGNYIPNITHYVHNYRIIESLLNFGIEIVMVDFLVTGFRPIHRLKQKFPEIGVWGHRVGYWPLERFISMKALGTLAVLAGVDFLHIGTPNNSIDVKDRLQLVSCLRAIKPQFVPVFTKTTPEVIREIVHLFNETTIFMACGYFRDHKGTINWGNVQEWITIAQSTIMK